MSETETETRTKLIRVAEIFGPTIQGEGPLIGRPTIFVRVGGCDYRCLWCDSLHAVDPVHRREWVPMSADDILDRVGELSGCAAPMLITLSGGNPALMPLGRLIDLAHDDGDTVAMETQGSVAPTWMSKLDHLIISPKPPSAGFTDADYGMVTPDRLKQLSLCIDRGPEHTCLKVVVFDDKDFEFARYIWGEFATSSVPLYLSVGNPDVRPSREPDALSRELLARYRWLVAKAQEAYMHDVTVLPQLHVLAWGNRRGV
jgi:7-carboxy-7-deazaguanine synthase